MMIFVNVKMYLQLFQVSVCSKILPKQGWRGWASVRYQDMSKVYDVSIPGQVQELFTNSNMYELVTLVCRGNEYK